MYEEIQNKINYIFQNPTLLKQALTHPSMSSLSRDTVNYERLEFLGDAVLSLVITEMLIKEFPAEDEGDLARRRAALISGPTLNKICNKISLAEYIVMTEGEENIGGRKNPQILEDVIEALIGALYLDGGLDKCNIFINRYWYDLAKTTKKPPIDTKTYLQEWSQHQGLGLPSYKLLEKKGSPHSPLFVIAVTVKTLPTFKSSAPTKKLAEKQAAQQMIDYIKNQKKS